VHREADLPASPRVLHPSPHRAHCLCLLVPRPPSTTPSLAHAHTRVRIHTHACSNVLFATAGWVPPGQVRATANPAGHQSMPRAACLAVEWAPLGKCLWTHSRHHRRHHHQPEPPHCVSVSVLPVLQVGLVLIALGALLFGFSDSAGTGSSGAAIHLPLQSRLAVPGAVGTLAPARTSAPSHRRATRTGARLARRCEGAATTPQPFQAHR